MCSPPRCWLSTLSILSILFNLSIYILLSLLVYWAQYHAMHYEESVMPIVPNPFKPTAGGNPPSLIGREQVARDFEKGLDNGVGAPGRIMLITGTRGTGKTVMLAELAKRARHRHWDVISETGSDGLCLRLLSSLSPQESRFERVLIKPELSVLGIGGSLGEIEFAKKTMPSSLRSALRNRLEALRKKNVGLLIAIDEAQAAQREDMVAIATATQHLVSEDADIAIAIAGLPELISDILNDSVLTFMRRAKREILADVPISEVAASYRETFNSAGMSLTDEQAQQAAECTYGYPYMVQLVGYNIWDQVVSRAHTNLAPVTNVDMECAIREANTELNMAVCEPELARLSPKSIAYLQALAQFDGAVRTAEVAEAMGVSSQYANTYRRRLLDAHILTEPRRGAIDFALPYLRTYIRACLMGDSDEL